MLYSHADYLQSVVRMSNLRKTVDNLVAMLWKYDFDSIAVTGTSGLLVGPSVAMAMNKELIVVRKSTEDNHSGRKIEGFASSERYVIVDDLLSSGKTVKNIRAAIYEDMPTARCLGCALYFDGHLGIEHLTTEQAAERKLRTEYGSQNLADPEPQPQPELIQTKGLMLYILPSLPGAYTAGFRAY